MEKAVRKSQNRTGRGLAIRSTATLVILSLVLLLMLAACSPAESQSSSTTTTGTTKASQTTATTATTASGETTKAVEDGGEIYLLRGANHNTGGFQLVLDLVQEQTGVKINPVWVESGNTVDQFVLRVTSGEPMDAAGFGMTTFPNYLEKGILMPLDDYLQDYGGNIMARVRSDLWNWVKGEDGKIYGIPNEQVAAITSLDVRKDWLVELGLDEPKTVEEYEAMLYAMQEKYDCNPLMVRLDLWGRHFEPFLCGAFLPMGWSWWENDEGVFLPPEMHPEYIEILKLLRKWWDDGLISPDSLSLRANGKALVEANKVGALMDSWGLGGLFSRDAVKVVPGLEFISLPALSGKYDLGNFAAMGTPSGQVVSATSTNPAGVIKVIDWIAAELENTIISRRGIKGLHWDYEDPDGPKPTRFVDAENKVVILTPEDEDLAFPGGALELLDINDFVEHQVTEDPYMIAANNWWTLNYSGALRTYMNLDDQYQVVEVTLPCLQQINDCKVAREEKTIAIITGADDLESWDAWINGEYQTIGMETVIEVKNQVYRERMGN